MNEWPSDKIFAHAMTKQIISVGKTEDGQSYLGIASVKPWIVWLGPHVVCTRCRVMEKNPEPMALDTDKKELMTAPRVYARHILAKVLYPFYRQHESCQKEAA